MLRKLLPSNSDSKAATVDRKQALAKVLAGSGCLLVSITSAAQIIIGGGGLVQPSPALAVRIPPTIAGFWQRERPIQEASQRVPDGIYLYGTGSQPEAIGNSYMVFELEQDKTVGAFYQPDSEFACFYGRVEADRLALNIIDPHEPDRPYAYAVKLDTEAVASSADGPQTSPLKLEGFYTLPEISDNDQRILDTCKEYHQKQVWGE
ncbi:MAG: hypothetical protein Fur0025_39730 [Oscillatoriaceae cyanobacterium]